MSVDLSSGLGDTTWDWIKFISLVTGSFLVFCAILGKIGLCFKPGTKPYWLFSPCILWYYPLDIYCWECLELYVGRFCVKFCCFPCRYFDCFKFTDKEFPPDASSLGHLVGDTASGVLFQGGKVEWIRASQINANDDDDLDIGLFNDNVNSKSIMQGQLGNCWLIAAMAALAEHEGAIYQLFDNKQRSSRGKYRIDIYDGLAEKWETVTIDDYIPCVNGQPIFTKPVGNAMWVLLLEKAFAKFCGSYANLESGHTIWALQAMTGDKCRIFNRKMIMETGQQKTVWARLDLFNRPNPNDPKDRRDCGFIVKDEKLDNDIFFEVLRKYKRTKSVISVSGASGAYGLIRQHAYSVIDVVTAAGYRLVQIRNPHGRGGEWQGNWSDKSPLWDKYPDVKRAAGFKGDIDDGAFFMSWEDFVQHWEMIEVVDRSLDLELLSLKVRTDQKRSICKACTWGCFSYWCLCKGPRYLCCPKRSKDETVDTEETCCFCIPIKKRQYKAVGQPVGTRALVATDGEDYEYDEEEDYEDEDEDSEIDEKRQCIIC